MKLDVPGDLRDPTVALRVLRREDAAPYAQAFAEDPDLGRLLGIERDPDPASFLSNLERQAERARNGLGLELAIADPQDDRFLGSVSLHSISWDDRRGEIGFWVAPQARHRGIATAALTLAVTWAFAGLGLLRLEMTTTPENPIVPALAARLGFRHEGTLRARNIERGRRVDILWFGLLREEWPA